MAGHNLKSALDHQSGRAADRRQDHRRRRPRHRPHRQRFRPAGLRRRQYLDLPAVPVPDHGQDQGGLPHSQHCHRRLRRREHRLLRLDHRRHQPVARRRRRANHRAGQQQAVRRRAIPGVRQHPNRLHLQGNLHRRHAEPPDLASAGEPRRYAIHLRSRRLLRPLWSRSPPQSQPPAAT